MSSKKNSYFFSCHASDQLHSRSSLKRGDVLALLATRSCVPVGIDKNRIHTVIYSLADNQPLVVVHDKKNLEIITILYFDYNNKFVISPDVAKEAQRLAERHRRHASQNTQDPIQQPQPKKPAPDPYEWIVLDPKLRQIKEDASTLVELYLSTIRGEKIFYTCTFGDLDCNTANIHNIPNLKDTIALCCSKYAIKPEDVYGIHANIGYRKPLKLGISKAYNRLLAAKETTL